MNKLLLNFVIANIMFFSLISCGSQQTTELQTKLAEANKKIAELEQTVPDEEVKPIKEAATIALRGFPTPSDIEASRRLSVQEKSIISEVRNLIDKTSKISKMSRVQFDGLSNEIAWATELTTVIARQIGTGQPDDDCATKCLGEYDRCKNSHCGANHQPKWYGCACCIPCSLQYMGCEGGCIVRPIKM